jgi:hypothetical protein
VTLEIPASALKPDGRQSLIAAAIQRGVGRLLRAHDFSILTEFTLACGRRADVIGVGSNGIVWIVEIKSSPEDFKADNKWPEYRDYCDRFSFAIPPAMESTLIPEEVGLIVADQWGAEIIREASLHALHASRRRAVLMSFGRTGAQRLHSLWDPPVI